jgi:DNA-binding CsgD family transcriptional regulator
MAKGDLTPKEIEALALIAQGHDAKSAARELSVSAQTIYERLRRAREKLGASNSRAAARQLFSGNSTDNEKSLTEFLVLSDARIADADFTQPGAPVVELKSRETGEATCQNQLPTWVAWPDYLPLRSPGERDVRATKVERLRLIGELSARLAMAFVAICLAAMVLSTILRRA